MSQTILRTSLGQASLLAVGLSLSACSGGGSSGSGSGFAVSSVSVQSNATVQINRPIEFTFTQPVDFSTVSLNTISITQVGGGPAAGEFRQKTKKADPLDPCSADVVVSNVIIFQPACPTQDDYSDAGLAPGGVQYQINIVGSATGGPTVQSSAGRPLAESQTLNFVTPTSTQASTLFVDPAVNTAPRAVISDPSCSSQTNVSYLELSGDSENRENFVKRSPADAALGADVETSGFLAPLNFYSDVNTKVAIVIQLNQPVNPSSTNVNETTVLLQYLVNEASPSVDTSWASVPHTVSLDVNCSATGAILRVTPVGILPQGRVVRVVLTPDFRDLVGNGNILPTVVGSFRARTATDPGTTTPGLTADAKTEPFSVGGTGAGSNQDNTAVLDAPPAVWGEDGQLKATFNFGGTGGPGGAFVYRVRSISNGSTVFNTTFQNITNEDQTLTEPCINGQIDVKDFIVDAGGVLEIRGPSPCVIRASGKVDIQGRIFLRGTNSRGVVSYSSANLPEAGGAGAAGGGRGGTGSYLTTQSTPRGESGYGAFNAPNGGGEGGETGFTANTDVNARRGAGGGGGAFAIDVPRLTGTTLNPACPEQNIIGLDAEDGSNGSPSASGAQHPVGQVPLGGKKGARPFIDNNPTDLTLAALDDDTGSPFAAKFHLNDFWGSMLVGTAVVSGELANPYAGAGGGGGGDACGTATFPTTPFSAINDKKGAGGGGGGGSLTILCLGNITFGAAGRIDASGGTGGGGENTNGTNRIGGGSGGGSGGHVILQAGGNIDFRTCVPGTAVANYTTGAGIFARGAEGGEGADGVGGTNPPSVENPPTSDMLPPNSYGAGAPCAFTGNAVGTVVGCGGDGGPGVIQLHVSDLSKILVPTAATTKISNIIRPNPIGTTPLNTDTPASWRQLLPIFGRNSKAVSKWIALGSTSVPPTGSTPKPITFLFGGTNTATGFVNSNGGFVTDLAPILSGTLAAEPTLPFITADKRSVVFDATTITDDAYIRNPGLIGQFGLRIVGGVTQRFDIATATYDATAHTLRVTVEDSGTPLNGLVGVASIIPRFFRVLQDGVLDTLTSSSTIKIEFQAAPATSSGLPNASLSTAWVKDINLLNTTVTPANTALRFFRFRVAFEIGVGSSSLDFNTPIPSLDFLKVPFKF